MGKIGELNQHCGNCGVVEYCGNPYGYCLCTDSRFTDVEEEKYAEIAVNKPWENPFAACMGCERPDCGQYSYGDTDYADESCENEDESRDYYCNQVADYVEEILLRELLCC